MSHYKPYPSYKDSGVEWLGRVPEHWVASRFSRVIAGIKDGTHGTFERVDDGQPLLSAKNVSDGVLDISSSESQISEADHASIVANGYPQRGDLLLTIVGSIGRACVYPYDYPLSFQRSVCFIRLTPERSPDFFRYFSQSKFFQEQIQSKSKSSAQAGIYMGDVAATSIAFPTCVEEQEAIVSCLDRETTRIDALIAKKTRFIELLREKRQALITHAVTKGLDPSVKMKDSGVEWLGPVPEHWVIKRFRDICISISTGPFGTALGNEDYVTGGVPVINPSHIVDDQCSPDPDITVSAETAERLTFWAMRTGDLVTARRGELGRAAVIFDEQDGWICGTGSLRVRPNPSQVLTGYLHTVLQSRYAREWLNLASVGATMANLNEGILGSLPLALPPSTPEQEQLLSSLATQGERLIKIEQKATLSVALLKERRSALITAAVTGQIDLREAV